MSLFDNGRFSLTPGKFIIAPGPPGGGRPPPILKPKPIIQKARSLFSKEDAERIERNSAERRAKEAAENKRPISIEPIWKILGLLVAVVVGWLVIRML